MCTAESAVYIAKKLLIKSNQNQNQNLSCNILQLNYPYWNFESVVACAVRAVCITVFLFFLFSKKLSGFRSASYLSGFHMQWSLISPVLEFVLIHCRAFLFLSILNYYASNQKKTNQNARSFINDCASILSSFYPPTKIEHKWLRQQIQHRPSTKTKTSMWLLPVVA
jgi:hypothetical protein